MINASGGLILQVRIDSFRRVQGFCRHLDWWRQGMMGGAKAHYDGIVAFSQTDFTEDLKKIHRAGPGDAWR
jgi:hypothetical protein